MASSVDMDYEDFYSVWNLGNHTSIQEYLIYMNMTMFTGEYKLRCNVPNKHVYKVNVHDQARVEVGESFWLVHLKRSTVMDMVLGPPKRYNLSGDPWGDKPLKPVLLQQLPKPVCRREDVPQSWLQIEQEQDVAKGLLASVIKKQGVLLTSKLPCLLYTSPSPRDKRQSRMPSSA